MVMATTVADMTAIEIMVVTTAITETMVITITNHATINNVAPVVKDTSNIELS